MDLELELALESECVFMRHSNKGTYMHSELWFCPQVKNFCDRGSASYDHFREGEAASVVIVVCRSRIHEGKAVSVAVAVDCALRLRTFAQKF